jgi:GntR family transcriptional regulator/MocR family aminotransferase
MREVLASTPASAFAYPDVRGAPELRRALAAYLRRVRGAVVEPESIVVCSGATQGLALLGRALAHQGVDAIAVEDPSLPPHRAVLAYAGLEVRGVAVDEEGVDVHALNAPVVLTTPAHQCPTGVVLSPARRAALVDWARAGGLVIEDDYDAEFRYDRAPPGALQGLAPDRVVYLGTASKTLAPGLRLGWLVLPASLVDSVVEAKLLDDLGSPTLEQLVLARLIDTAAYDRHLRKARRRNRDRRDALIAAVAQHFPHARVSGISAGLHALVRLPWAIDAQKLLERAAERSVGVYPLTLHMMEPARDTDALVLGYAGLSEPAIEAGIRRLAESLDDLFKEVSYG